MLELGADDQTYAAGESDGRRTRRGPRRCEIECGAGLVDREGELGPPRQVDMDARLMRRQGEPREEGLPRDLWHGVDVVAQEPSPRFIADIAEEDATRSELSRPLRVRAEAWTAPSSLLNERSS